MSPKNKYYSTKFAIGVVQNFLKSYRRGSYILARKLDISSENLFYLLTKYVSSSQIKWEAIKIVIKQLQYDDIKCNNIVEYLTNVKQMIAKDRIKWENDTEVKQNILDVASFFNYDDIRTSDQGIDCDERQSLSFFYGEDNDTR